ncbi:MAG: hypothetical protein AAFX58_03760 [Pseudomonadota bacterium]
MKVNVYIDRIVLDGLPLAARDRPLLLQSVQAEVASSIRDHGPGVLARGGAVARRRGPDIRVAASSSAEGLGAALSRSVYRSIVK